MLQKSLFVFGKERRVILLIIIHGEVSNITVGGSLVED